MERVRILHFVSSLSKNSGVMSVVMNYYRQMDKNKIQFDFIHFKDTDNAYGKEIMDMGGETYLCPNPKNILSFYRYLNSFFKDNASQYVAIQLHTIYLNSMVLPVAKKYGIENRMVHNHATRYSDKRVNSIRNRILYLPYRKNSTHFIACSKAAGVFLYGEKALNEKKVYILNNAIDMEKFDYSLLTREKMRKYLKIENKFVVGHVGRFSEPKNHVFIIKIFAELCSMYHNAILMLAGEGPLEEKIRGLVKEYNLEDKVLFLGLRTDIHELMQAMDVFVLPSLYEGLPVVGVEAQAAGLPCIISDTVTNEIKISDLVTFKNLNDPPVEWVNAIIKTKDKMPRHNTNDEIKNAGFNIKFESQKLQNFYLNL